MHDFALHRPATVHDAVRVYAGAASAFYLAGGQTLVPTLKHRLAEPSDVVDLSGIPVLRGIELRGRSVRIGAMQCHSSIAESPIVREHLPALAALAVDIGDQMVRNRGTLGGAVANNDPAADYPAAVLGLGAIVQTDRRNIAADEFFVGMFETALQPAELIVAIEFPVPDAAIYVKSPHPASGYALVGVFIARFGTRVRVAVTGATPSVRRVPAVEDALGNRFQIDTLDSWAPAAGELNSDMHASAEFRAQLLTVLTRRAVAAIAR